MSTTTLNRATASEVRDALEQALANVAENVGLTLRIGTIRFTDSNLRCQVEMARTWNRRLLHAVSGTLVQHEAM